MKRTKKLFTIFVAICAAVSMSSCGKGDNSKSTSQKTSDTVSEVFAESSIESEAESSIESSIESKTESKPESKMESKTESKPECKAESKPESKTESKAESKPESKTESKSESKPVSKPETSKQTSRQESETKHETTESPSGEAHETSKKPEQSEISKQESLKPVSEKPKEESQKPAYVEISGIKLSEKNISMTVGSTYKMYATMVPENATRDDFVWKWSDDSVISLSDNGTVKAKAEGTATITVETYNKKTDVCTVTVTKKPPEPVKPKEPEQTSKPSSENSQPKTEDKKPVSGNNSSSPERSGTYVGASWFDDAVFVGDSVSVTLANYADDYGALGNADYLCAVSLGYNNALWDLYNPNNVHPKYNGTKVTVDEGVRLSGKKKVFIMLGMNDVGLYGVDGTIDGMITLTNRILQKSPDVQIYIQTVTPLIRGMARGGLNNTNVALYNEKARQVCAERGFIFVDVASAVEDSEGYLIYDYCGDPNYMGLHFNYKGCAQWVEYLKRHVE